MEFQIPTEKRESKELIFYERYKLGKLTRHEFIGEKQRLDDEIKKIRDKQPKVIVKEEKIQEVNLTRELMEKYIKKVTVRGNEILEIEWK